jgi:hypothetical protein
MGIPTPSPLHNTYGSKIVRLSKAPPVLSSLSSSRLSQIALKLSAIKDASSIVIRTQGSNVTIFPQLHENETHHIFSINIRSVTPIKKFPTGSNGSRNTTATALPERIAFVAPTFTTAAYNISFMFFIN